MKGCFNDRGRGPVVRFAYTAPWISDAMLASKPARSTIEMAVMLTIPLQGRGSGEQVALNTHGRIPGVSHGLLIWPISTEVARGGPIGAVRDGDTIDTDPRVRTLTFEVPDEEVARRMQGWAASHRVG